MEHSLTATWTMLSSNGKVVLRSEDSELSITLEPEQAVTLERLLAGWPNNAHPELEPIRNELIHRGALRPLAVSPSPQQDRQIEFWRAFTDHATEAVESVGVATVALVGVGGIGSVVLQHLVGAGVSRFRLLDADIVEESNLNRQFIYSRSSVGTSKAKAAQAYIVDRIQNVDVSIRAEKWDPRSHDQQEFLLHGVDFIVAAIDRPSINSSIEVLDAAWQAGVPAILATVGLNKSLVTQVFAQSQPARRGRRCVRACTGSERVQRAATCARVQKVGGGGECRECAARAQPNRRATTVSAVSSSSVQGWKITR